MTFIKLNEDGIIINIAGTLHTINRKSLNFNKISKLLSDESTNQEEIINLLKPVDLVDGIYEAYLHEPSLTLRRIHYTDNSSFSVDLEGTDLKFLGVYATKEDMRADWPEYSL